MIAGNRLGTPTTRVLARLYLLAGGVGLLAAAVLLIEKIELLKDPSYVPSCSINPILSCGSIMRTSQAEIFGFPNPILGIVGFTIVVTTGAALLATSVPFARWYWAGLQAGVIAAVVLIHWLIFQSLYRIDALCPYCMVVWAVTIPIAWYTTLRNAQAWSTPGSRPERCARWVATYHSTFLVLWYLTVSGLILARFWDYWSTLVP